MRPIVTDVAWSVCVSVCLSVGHNREPHKIAKPIKVSFGVWTCVGPRNRKLGEGHRERKCADTVGTVLVPWSGHLQC